MYMHVSRLAFELFKVIFVLNVNHYNLIQASIDLVPHLTQHSSPGFGGESIGKQSRRKKRVERKGVQDFLRFSNCVQLCVDTHGKQI